MRKLLLILLIYSSYILAEGKIGEQGVNNVTFTCTPPYTRSDGTPITLEELSHTTIISINRVTNEEVIYSPLDLYCNVEIISDDYEIGQYDVVATATDTEGRESVRSPEKVPFEIIPNMNLYRPNPPTDGIIQ